VIVTMIDRRKLMSAALPGLALLALRPCDARAAETPAAEKEPTPEERMQRRFPQPVRVDFLIGLPVLDWQDSTLGFVKDVVRTPAGKIELVVPYGGWFGRGGRPVAVPIEGVAILARQIAALDMGPEQFKAAPTWTAADGQPIAPTETIKIAITRR
jgi:PRC-barrel domain